MIHLDQRDPGLRMKKERSQLLPRKATLPLKVFATVLFFSQPCYFFGNRVIFLATMLFFWQPCYFFGNRVIFLATLSTVVSALFFSKDRLENLSSYSSRAVYCKLWCSMALARIHIIFLDNPSLLMR